MREETIGDFLPLLLAALLQIVKPDSLEHLHVSTSNWPLQGAWPDEVLIGECAKKEIERCEA